MRLYVSQRGEKGKGQRRDRLVSPSEPRAVCHTPEPPALPAVLANPTRKKYAKKFCGTAGALAPLAALANTGLQVCGQALDAVGWQEVRVCHMAMGRGLCCQPRPEEGRCPHVGVMPCSKTTQLKRPDGCGADERQQRVPPGAAILPSAPRATCPALLRCAPTPYNASGTRS